MDNPYESGDWDAMIGEPSQPKGRVSWQAEVFSMEHLLAHIGWHPEDMHLVQPNMVELRKIARNTKGLGNIPGVSFVKVNKEEKQDD